MKKIVLSMVAAAALVAGSGWAIAQHGQVPMPEVRQTAQAHAIPFKLFRGNRVVASASLNGHVTEVILDTGASVTTIDRAYARSIGLPPGRKITAVGAGGNTDAELVPNVTLEIGGTRFEKMSVAVMDLSPVARAIGRPMNIVVGREFFNAAVVSIDWPASQLRITPHAGFVPRKEATVLQLKRRGPFNTIPVTIGGDEPVEALLDLGNGGALSIPETYWGGRPDLASLPYAEGQAGGVGGLHPSRSTTVPRVTIAGKTLANVPATLGSGGSNHEPARMTNVGIGLLKQFQVDLDLGRDRIYLLPRADAPAFGRERAGARFDLLGDRLKVAFVSRQGPAAAAGLREGDEILAIDGKPITKDIYAEDDWARGAAGTPVRLQRADGTIVTVTLKDYY